MILKRDSLIYDVIPPTFLGLIVLFSSLFKGAHDLWAATLVHIGLLIGISGLLLRSAFSKEKLIHLPMVGGLVAIVIAVLLSFASAVNPSESLLALKDFFAVLVVFVLSVNWITSEKQHTIFSSFVAFSFLIQLLLALLTRSFWQGETAPTLINPNIQAAFALAWCPLLISFSIRSKKERIFPRWFWVATLLANVAMILLSHSTWAMMCLILMGLCYFPPTQRKAKGVVAVAGLALVTLLFFKLFPAIQGHQSFNHVFNRLLWWKTAILMFLDQPWTGIGWGNYSSAFLSYKAGVGENTLFAHSFIFQILAEAGLVGLVCFSLAFFSWIKKIKTQHERSVIEQAALTGIFLLLAFCLIHVGLEYLVNKLSLGLLAGIVCSNTSFPALKFKPRLSVGFLLVGLFVLLLPWLVSPFLSSRHLVTGRMHIEEGKFEEADKSFGLAIELDPFSWEAYHDKAKLALVRFQSTGDRTELEVALELQEKAIERNRRNSILWGEKGFILERHGDQAAAQMCFDKARQLQPAHAFPSVEK